jgi:hypothetical protein
MAVIGKQAGWSVNGGSQKVVSDEKPSWLAGVSQTRPQEGN